MVMMKKTLAYIGMVVSILVMLTSCKSDILESFGSTEGGTDGVPVTLTFQTSFPDVSLSTRTVDDVKNLTLLVFDENHRYLYRAKATLDNITTAGSEITFLPEHTQPAIDNKIYKFSVTLMTSTKPRIIHFVANYNDFDAVLGEDHTQEGADEGEVMPKLISHNINQYSYWQVFKFDKIEANSFANKAFKLLRNEAKIAVESVDPRFTIMGFAIHNAPDRGTVAPYFSKIKKENDPRGIYSDVLYSFPYDPTETSIPAGLKLKVLGDAKTNKAPISLYEYSNEQATPDKQMTIILYGKRNQDANPSYYKLDIVDDIYADEDKKVFVGIKKIDLVRNNHYTIRVSAAKKEGYSTFDEAVKHPASNDIFSSVELQEFSEVSDGSYTLLVENTNAIMTLPGLFATHINFTGANLSVPTTRDVKVFLNGKECNGPIVGDDYIDYADYNANTGALSVNVKAIPTVADKRYTFTVVGTPPDLHTHIQRTVTLVVRKRYNFNLQLIELTPDKKQGAEVNLKFKIPGTLPSTLFPFDVYIAADQLSPLVKGDLDDHMKVQKIGKRTYYVYTVTTASTQDQDITLHFQRTRSDGTSDVTLISEHFNNADVILPNSQSECSDSKGRLTYSGGSYSVPKVVPSDYRTTVKATGVAGVTAKMVSAGYVEFTGLNTVANGLANLTLTTEINVGNGILTATKTQTVNQWKQQLAAHQTMDLDISKVVVSGTIKYQVSSANADLNPLPSYVNVKVKSDNATVNSKLELKSDGVYTFTISNLNTVKSPVAFSFEADKGTTKYESNSMYISKLFDHPEIVLSVR